MVETLILSIVGTVLCGILWRVARELGCIKNTLSSIGNSIGDHETRLRSVEATCQWLRAVQSKRTNGQE
jgi:hypothetical protein